ncbi:MAG: DMT family transporter [Sphingomicrobium sp.]
MNRPSAPSATVAAYVAATIGIATFSIMDMVMKGLTIAVGIFAAFLFRSLAGLALSGSAFAVLRPGWPDRSTLMIHVRRGLLMTPMGLLFFWGLARVPMAQAIALSFIAPLIALALSSVLLGEQLGRRTLQGSLLAFVGVGVIFIGTARADLGRSALLGSAAIIVSALVYAYNIILMRQQAQAARPSEIAFFQNLVVSLTLLCAVPFMGFPELSHVHVPEIIAAALLGFSSQILLAWAYARAGAGYLSTTEYSSFLWAMALGWLRFAETVAPWTLAGAGLILCGCLLAARTDHPVLEASA